MTYHNHELLGKVFFVPMPDGTHKRATVTSIAGPGLHDQIVLRGKNLRWADPAWRVWADVKSGALVEV